MSTNPNNCSTCNYREPNVGGAHCYMWKAAPTDVCHAHTIRKETFSSILYAMKAAIALRKCLSCGAVETASGTIPCGH